MRMIKAGPGRQCNAVWGIYWRICWLTCESGCVTERVGGAHGTPPCQCLPSSAYAAVVDWTPARIRRARVKRHWSQQQLADAAHVVLRTVGSWERGETAPQNPELLDDIFGDDEPAAPGPTLAEALDVELLAELGRRLFAYAAARPGRAGQLPQPVDGRAPVEWTAPLDDDDELGQVGDSRA